MFFSQCSVTRTCDTATRGQSCTQACRPAGAECNVTAISAVDEDDLKLLGNCIEYPSSDFNIDPFEDPGSPSVFNNNGCLTNPAPPSSPNYPTCDAFPIGVTGGPKKFDDQRVCVCNGPPTDGGGGGDPHIHSLRGAHYTLLQQGVFVAWNFSKAVPAPAVPGVPGAAPAAAAAARGWQLLASYAGNSFTTQGLLLHPDRHSGQSMEITAEDCSWRVKEKTSPWRKAQVELLSAEDGMTSLQVEKLHEKLGETKMLRSAILLQMKSGSDMKDIGKLVVHCRPQNHLDFKITMFQKSDINHVGGELGVAPDGNNNYHFLFSKQGMMRMRADQEFKAGMIQIRYMSQTMETHVQTTDSHRD